MPRGCRLSPVSRIKLTMANNNGGQSPADIAGIISSAAVAIVLTVVGIYTKIASMPGKRQANGKPVASKQAESDERTRLDSALEFADDYRERLKASESRLQALETALETSKTDCLQQIEAVNAARDKQLAAVVKDYDSKIDRLTGRVRELESMASGDGK